MVSIITPVLPEHRRFLPAALSSLHEQQVEWEWRVVVDGPVGWDEAPDCPSVHVSSTGRSLGISVSRNRALAASRGEFVFALDADDELLPDALTHLSEAIASRPLVLFSIGRAIDWFPDGRRIFRFAENPYDDGPLPIGSIEAVWRDRKNHFLQPGAALWRRDAVIAAGGWPAITGMEDTDLLLTLNSWGEGAYTDREIMLYRQHSGQTVRTSGFETERETNRRWCHERLAATYGLRGRGAPDCDVPLPTAVEITGFTTREWREAASQCFGVAE